MCESSKLSFGVASSYYYKKKREKSDLSISIQLHSAMYNVVSVFTENGQGPKGNQNDLMGSKRIESKILKVKKKV